jgi:hypothetical protein
MENAMTKAKSNKIVNADTHGNFTIIPNIIDDLDLTPSAVRLYLHIKRVAGDNKICWQSGSTLAKKCHMSEGMVSKVKKELVEAELIAIEEIQCQKGTCHNITILDLWKRNFEQYPKKD